MRSNLFHLTSKMVAFARSGKISDARKLFDEMPYRDTVAWNAMLTAYSQLGLYQETFFLFKQMRKSHDTIKPDPFTFTSILSASAGAGNLRYGLVVHGSVFISGRHSSLPVNNSLIDMYAKCMSPFSAERVFEEMGLCNDITWCSLLFGFTNSGMMDIASQVFRAMPERIEIAWNIMVAGHARLGDTQMCLSLFREMRGCANCHPDQMTLSALVSACSKVEESASGTMVHAFVVKTGWSSSTEMQNSILTFYAKTGCQKDTLEALESIDHLDEVSCNAVIDAYLKMGNTHEAFIMFQRATEKDIITWTSMISGYTKSGQEREALGFFVDMMEHGVKPDVMTFSAVLLACSSLALLKHGMMIHSCLFQHGFHGFLFTGNDLVNMYAKCGDLGASRKAFDYIIDKDVVSWNTMLFAYGMHGWASQTLQVYEEMISSGVKPDKVTFIGLLMTCSHAGLVEKAWLLFESMRSVYGLLHEAYHVACMVDMLGRGGYLEEAGLLAKEYQGLPGLEESSNEALLGACSVKFDLGVGAEIGETLMISEPSKEMSYILLSNLYCASGKWKESEMIRKAMIDQGVKKMPGCSWIEVRNELITFVSGDRSNPGIDNVYNLLQSLRFEMGNPYESRSIF